MDKKSKIKKILSIIIPILISIIIIFLFSGPRVHFKKKINNIIIPQKINDLSDYLYNKESRIKNLKKDTEKKIIWINKKKIKTEYAIIYIHGFSATRKEIFPVVEKIGKKLNANIFFTRLKAHGRDKDAYIDVKANDWLNDAYEALKIGKKIGKNLIIISASTSTILTIDLALNDPDIKSIVLISPNFGLHDKRSNIVFYPWGKTIAKIINGSNYFKFESESKDEEYYWTREYHINGFFEMMSLIQYSKRLKYHKIKIPCLIIYTENDIIIDVKKVLEIYYKIGSKSKKIVNLKEAKKHVLAGNIKSPETNNKTIDLIYNYILNNL